MKKWKKYLGWGLFCSVTAFVWLQKDPKGGENSVIGLFIVVACIMFILTLSEAIDKRNSK